MDLFRSGKFWTSSRKKNNQKKPAKQTRSHPIQLMGVYGGRSEPCNNLVPLRSLQKTGRAGDQRNGRAVAHKGMVQVGQLQYRNRNQNCLSWAVAATACYVFWDDVRDGFDEEAQLGSQQPPATRDPAAWRPFLETNWGGEGLEELLRPQVCG